MLHWSNDSIDPQLEAEGLEALEAADSDDWACFEDAGTWLPVVARSREGLMERGTFERALVRAWYAQLGTTWAWEPRWIRDLFLVYADRDQLRREGSPIPPGDRIPVFRGVAGLDPYRRENGLSWTTDVKVARRFANCSCELGLADPEVLGGIVRRKDVFVHITARCERELICEAVTIVSRERVRPGLSRRRKA